MKYGLRDSDIDYIIKTIKSVPSIKKAVIFGSRANGTHKNGSDVDLAIFGDEVSFDVVAKLHNLLEEESPMPYMFDVVDYTHLVSNLLKEQIDSVGKTIYESESSFN